MNKNIFLIIPFFFFFSIITDAQVQFLKGFIIKGTDTTHCFIKKEPLKTLQYNIVVKNTLEISEVVNYTPDDLDGFYIESFGLFISKDITVRYVTDIMKSTDYWALENEKFVNDKAFIKLVTYGKANLYFYFDKEKSNHYFIEKDKILNELYETYRFEHYKEKNIEKRKLLITKPFLKELSKVFNDCSKILSDLESVKLNENSLKKITVEYNVCKGFISSNDVKTKNFIFEKSIIGGISYNNFLFLGDDEDFFNQNLEPFNNSFTAGLNLNILFPKISYDFSLYTGLFYNNNKFNTVVDTFKNYALHTYYVDLNTHFLKFPILLRYTLNRYKVKPYIFAGGFIGFVIKGKNELLIHTENEFIDRIKETYVFNILDKPANRNYEIGYTLGVGVKTKLTRKLNLFVESRYEGGNGISGIATFGVFSKYYSFVTGIEF